MRGRVAAAVLLLLSFSSPAIPQCTLAPRASVPFRSTAYDVAVDGGDLWVASGYGIELLDRTVDPPLPRLSLALPGVTRGVRVGSGVVYAASDDALFVVRREGNALRAVSTITAGGTINDLALASHLYLATSRGVEQYELVNPASPARTSASFPTTNQAVQSLAISGTTLYAADGDSTVEVFSIASATSPVKTATLESLPRSIAVHVARDRVYVSDGQNTEVFLGTVRGAQFPYGSTSFATITGDEHFVAGTDRAVRAVDFGVASRPVEMFEAQLPPHGGTNNRVFAMQRSGDRLYVAAGDIGLASFDTSSFARPYGMANYRTGATATIDRLRVASPSAGMTEYALDPAGLSLSVVSTRPATEVEKVHPGGYTSKGKTVQLIPPSGPHTRNWTYASNVQALASAGAYTFVLLENGTVRRHYWTDLSGSGEQLEPEGKTAKHLASDGTTIVVASITEAGDTELRVFEFPYVEAVRTIRVQGVVIGNIAAPMDGTSTAAVFTWRGINLVNLATGAVTVLPGSDTRLFTQLRFAGTELLATTDHALVVWDLAKQRITTEIALPSEPVALDVASSGVAIVATRDGVAAVRYRNPGLPVASEPRNANRYYSSVAAAGERLYLADADSVDIYSTAFGFTPRFVASVATPGLAGLAASDSALFTLANNGVVRMWTVDGAPLRERSLHDGSTDWQPAGIAAAGGKAWVSYSRGCLTTGCERTTVVLDPASLSTAQTLAGIVTDLAVNGGRAAVLFAQPSELRTYDLANGAQLGLVPVASGATSVAFSGSEIYLLGSKIAVYDGSTLTPKDAPADPQPVKPGDDRIRVAGSSCGVVTGRRSSLDVRAVPGWSSSSSTVALPSTVRGIAVSGSRVFVLTDHSVEVLDPAATAPTLPRRRATR